MAGSFVPKPRTPVTRAAGANRLRGCPEADFSPFRKIDGLNP